MATSPAAGRLTPALATAAGRLLLPCAGAMMAAACLPASLDPSLEQGQDDGPKWEMRWMG